MPFCRKGCFWVCIIVSRRYVCLGPLQLRLTRDIEGDAHFMTALCSFQTHTCYANTASESSLLSYTVHLDVSQPCIRVGVAKDNAVALVALDDEHV